MNYIMKLPFLVLALTFVALWFSARTGAFFRKRRRNLDEDERQDLGVVEAAALTLLGLIIGFSFSMALSRYDQRKQLEEEEANAIGTEYVRADLLPADDAARVHTLLRNYLEQRILFYETSDNRQLGKIDAATAQLKSDLWSAVKSPAAAQPTPLVALAVSGMNDVLNSQGYTHAAWRNRIPVAAWGLMAGIAICCNLLIGYGGHRAEAKAILLLVLPLVVSISFFPSTSRQQGHNPQEHQVSQRDEYAQNHDRDNDHNGRVDQFLARRPGGLFQFRPDFDHKLLHSQKWVCHVYANSVSACPFPRFGQLAVLASSALARSLRIGTPGGT